MSSLSPPSIVSLSGFALDLVVAAVGLDDVVAAAGVDGVVTVGVTLSRDRVVGDALPGAGSHGRITEDQIGAAATLDDVVAGLHPRSPSGS